MQPMMMNDYVCLGEVKSDYQINLDKLKQRFGNHLGTRLLVIEFGDDHCEAICEYDETPGAEQFASNCELSVYEEPI